MLKDSTVPEFVTLQVNTAASLMWYVKPLVSVGTKTFQFGLLVAEGIIHNERRMGKTLAGPDGFFFSLILGGNLGLVAPAVCKFQHSLV